MNHRQNHLAGCLLSMAALLSTASIQEALAQTAPSLGTASNFAALGGAGVTCTSPFPPLPAITITGDVGSLLAAPSSVTGFLGFTPGANRCSLAGTVQLGATAAHADFVTAYNTLAAIPCPSDAPHLLSGDLGGMTLSPGVYCISGVGLLTSQLTLSGPSTGIWIFKAASSITPIGGSVVMAGGGNACNVYWQLGTAASFDNTDFVGNVLAGSAITFTGVGSSLVGRALARNESVTTTGANINNTCGVTQPPPPDCKPDKCCKGDKGDKGDKCCKGDKGGKSGNGDKCCKGDKGGKSGNGDKCCKGDKGGNGDKGNKGDKDDKHCDGDHDGHDQGDHDDDDDDDHEDGGHGDRDDGGHGDRHGR